MEPHEDKGLSRFNANEEQLKILRQGAEAWNKWRTENPDDEDLGGRGLEDLRGTGVYNLNLKGADLTSMNLSGANLSWMNLKEAHLYGSNLKGADLCGANLWGADLRKTDLRKADLCVANLCVADLRETNLSGADLSGVNLSGADLSGVNLSGADLSGVNLRNLSGANLSGANLSGADLSGADLSGADLSGADLSGANLSGADLTEALLIRTNLEGANLMSCSIYGISAWGSKLKDAKQKDLIITSLGEPAITVDNLEVAQFIYLLIHNEKIRDVIDTITSKVVLILGRFTPERMVILDAIKEELRNNDLLPVLFNFEGPISRTKGETVSTLAHLARFVIADITDARSIPAELERIVKMLPSVPVKPLILESDKEYALFEDIEEFQCVLEPYRYKTSEQLFASFKEEIIEPAENRANEIQIRRLQKLNSQRKE